MTFAQLTPRANLIGRIGVVYAYGHSFIAGNGASSSDRDMMTLIAAGLGAKEMNYAVPGAVINFDNAINSNRYGVVPQLLQGYRRPVRAASALSAGSSIGATVISVTPNPLTGSTTGPAFKFGDVVHIGIGSTSGTLGGEIARVASASATQITLDGFEGGGTGLARAHLSGEPVFVVPTRYGAGNTLFLLSEIATFVMKFGSGATQANAKRWYQESLRTCIVRMCAAEVYEPDHTSLVFAGTWAAAAWSQAASGSFAAQGGRQATANGSTVTWHLPDNYNGEPISMTFLQTGASGTVLTFTVDGAAWTVNGVNTGSGNTVTTVTGPASPATLVTHYTPRLTGLTPGRHTIVATATTIAGSSTLSFDCATIESKDPPIVMLFKQHRGPLDKSGDSVDSTNAYGYIRPTLTSQANPGATSIAISQSPVASARQITAGSIPAVGEIFVIEPQADFGSQQEVRTVTSVTGAGAPFTVNFSGGALANTHAVGARVEFGIKAWDLRQIVPSWIDEVKAEFSDNVIVHDLDALINADPNLFAKDQTHLNDEGASRASEHILTRLEFEARLNMRSVSRLTRPLSTMTVPIDFFRSPSTITTWSNITGTALIELFGVTHLRAYRDMRNVYDARLIVQHGTLVTPPASNFKMRVQYSIDSGANWRYLHRAANSTFAFMQATSWLDMSTANGADFSWGEIDLLSTVPANAAPKVSNWVPIYPECQQYDSAMLRVVVVGGNGTVDIPLGFVTLEMR